MTDEKKALFETLPGNITLNSLYIPGRGASHLIMGDSSSKLEALQAIHHHLGIWGYTGLEDSKYLPLTERLGWQDIEPRNEKDKGNRLPVRSQRGVSALVLPKKHNGGKFPVTASIYADDYATGRIPWTLRTSGNSTPELFDQMHNQIKNWFVKEGNQKTSFFKRFKRAGYNIPNQGLSSDDEEFLGGQIRKNKSKSTGGDWRTQLPNLAREWSEMEPILAQKFREQGKDVGRVYGQASRTLKLCIDAKQDFHPNYESVTGKKRNA